MVNDREFYNEIYTENPQKWESVLRDIIAFGTTSKYASSPKMMLDIGCGNGHTIGYFADRWVDTEYVGIDLSDVAIAVARMRVPKATFTRSSLEDWYLGWKDVDVIIVMGVAEHFEDLSGSLAILKSLGAIVYLEVPNCLFMSGSDKEGFRKTKDGADQKEWHLRRETWESHLVEADFEIVESVTGPLRTYEFIWVIK